MSPLTKLRLKYIHAYRDRHGKRRFYCRCPGRKEIPLPGLPGSAAFMAAYHAALAGEQMSTLTIGASRHTLGSVAAVVAIYLGSSDFTNLSPATRRDRRRILERFRETYGEQDFAALTGAHVDKILATFGGALHAARNLLKALRAMIPVAKRGGFCSGDPTAGLRIEIKPSADGFRTWTEDDIAQFEARWPIGSRERLALGLLLYTGQRRGDVIRLGRQHVRDGFLTVHQDKTGAAVTLPIRHELKAILAGSAIDHLTFLTTATGKPFAPGAFTNWFGCAVRQAGLPLGLSAHGLRKAMCRRAAAFAIWGLHLRLPESLSTGLSITARNAA
jgi:integrase